MICVILSNCDWRGRQVRQGPRAAIDSIAAHRVRGADLDRVIALDVAVTRPGPGSCWESVYRHRGTQAVPSKVSGRGPASG